MGKQVCAIVMPALETTSTGSSNIIYYDQLYSSVKKNKEESKEKYVKEKKRKK